MELSPIIVTNLCEDLCNELPDFWHNDINSLRDLALSALRPPAVAPEGEAADARMRNDYPKLAAFFTKHALGPLARPSCLVCGKDDDEQPAIKHMELPGIIVCQRCVEKVSAHPAPPAVSTEGEKCVMCDSPNVKVGRTSTTCADCDCVSADELQSCHALIDQLRPAPPAGASEGAELAAEVQRLREGLRWYADGQHYQLDPEWELEEGWLCPPNDEAWMIEPGAVARAILNGGSMAELEKAGDETPPSPPQAQAAGLLLLEFADELFGSFIERCSLGRYGLDGWGYRCQHCEKVLDIRKWTTAEHEPDCVILKARAILPDPTDEGYWARLKKAKDALLSPPAAKEPK